MIRAPLRYDSASADDFRRLRQRLGEIGYSPEHVARSLGLSNTGGLYPLDYRFLPRWDSALSASDSELSPVVRLLLLGLPVDKISLIKSLGAEQAGFLVATGLSIESGATFHPRLSIVPFERLLVATDRLFMNADPETAEEGLSSDNCVWRLDQTTYLMSKAMLRGPRKSVLELGCGSGVLALLIAECAERVAGVDINPRAVNVARFNARLNGIDNVDFLQGDLYQPVQGREYERIISNPPSAPGLVRAWNREGGGTGREVVEAMLRGLGRHLESGGQFQSTMHFGYREGEDLARWAEKILSDDRFIVRSEPMGEVEDAEAFALREAWQKSGPRDYAAFARTYKMYLDNLSRAGIGRICFGLLTVERQ